MRPALALAAVGVRGGGSAPDSGWGGCCGSGARALEQRCTSLVTALERRPGRQDRSVLAARGMRRGTAGVRPALQGLRGGSGPGRLRGAARVWVCCAAPSCPRQSRREAAAFLRPFLKGQGRSCRGSLVVPTGSSPGPLPRSPRSEGISRCAWCKSPGAGRCSRDAL